MDALSVLLARLILAFDLLYDGAKGQTAVWSIISDVVEEMQLIARGVDCSSV